ncbi:MAG: hypothetical protein ACOYT7_02130, partial [Patescibacteria group bacterium]
RAFLKAVPILLPAVATACGVWDTRANMPWPPESSPTPQATEATPTVEATPEPTLTPQATPTPELPDYNPADFPEEVASPINTLREAGLGVYPREDDQGRSILYLWQKGESLPVGEINTEDATISFTTEKNEPVTIPLSLLQPDGEAIVANLGRHREMLVSFRDGVWSGPPFLAAGESWYQFEEGSGLPTGIHRDDTLFSVLVDISDEGSIRVGFYDEDAALHIYEISFSNQSLVGICLLPQHCEAMNPADATERLREWYSQSDNRQMIAYLIPGGTDSITQEIITALREHKGFPSAPEGFSIPVNQVSFW